MNHSTSAPQ